MMNDRYVFHPAGDKALLVLAAFGLAAGLYLQRHDETVVVGYSQLHELQQSFEAVRGERCAVHRTKDHEMEFFEKNVTLAECFEAARFMVPYTPTESVTFTLRTDKHYNASGSCSIRKNRTTCEVDVPAYDDQQGKIKYEISLTPATNNEPG